MPCLCRKRTAIAKSVTAAESTALTPRCRSSLMTASPWRCYPTQLEKMLALLRLPTESSESQSACRRRSKTRSQRLRAILGANLLGVRGELEQTRLTQGRLMLVSKVLETVRVGLIPWHLFHLCAPASWRASVADDLGAGPSITRQERELFREPCTAVASRPVIVEFVAGKIPMLLL